MGCQFYLLKKQKHLNRNISFNSINNVMELKVYNI